MAKPKTDTPDALFNRTHYDQLRLHRRKLADMLSTIDKAGMCGINCDFIKAERDRTDQQLAMIEQHFMTPPPGK